METVNNLINAATNMVYGDSNQNNPTGTRQGHESPVGNQTNAAASSNNTTGGQEPLSGYTGVGTATNPHDAGNTTGEHINSTSNIGSTIPSSSGPSIPPNSGFAATENTTSTKENSKASSTATSSQDTGLEPSESVAASTIKHQGADASNDTPNITQSHAISQQTKATETVLSQEKNPLLPNTSTPTPAGTSGISNTTSPSHEMNHTPKSFGCTSTSHSHNHKDELGSVSAEKGTGEKYIKSSGTIADGGDFDAARAGAGREADRLLELKGIVREPGNNTAPPPHDAPGNKVAASASEEKHGLGQKLKDKLHIKSKDKP